MKVYVMYHFVKLSNYTLITANSFVFFLGIIVLSYNIIALEQNLSRIKSRIYQSTEFVLEAQFVIYFILSELN